MLCKTWGEVIEYSEGGRWSDLAPIVRLVNNYDFDRLISALITTNKVCEADFGVVFSTAYKSKIRGWRTVKFEDVPRHTQLKMYSD